MKRFIIIIVLLFLYSCASVPPEDYLPKPEGEYVTASWYGQQFHGRPTSSGERFNMYDMTCAHKTLKFGTRLRVTNPDNNKSVVVTVNDRGPFVRGRDLDLSYRAAREIDLIPKGVGRVKIEYLGRDMRYAKRVPFTPSESSEPLTIQVGSFIEKSNAFRLKRGLEVKYKNVFITKVHIEGEKYYRVKIGKFRKHDNAFAVAQELADEGYNVFITAN